MGTNIHSVWILKRWSENARQSKYEMLRGQIVILPLSAASSKMEPAHRQNDLQSQGVTQINLDEHYSNVTAGMLIGADGTGGNPIFIDFVCHSLKDTLMQNSKHCGLHDRLRKGGVHAGTLASCI